MKALISTTDFVLEQEKNYAHTTRCVKKNPFLLVVDYAKFMKQPLTLGMFIPCGDRYGNVLREPNRFNFEHERDYEIYLKTYAEAKERVLFKGFKVKDDYAIGTFEDEMICVDEEFCQDINIEQFLNTIWSEIELTDSALKQIGIKKALPEIQVRFHQHQLQTIHHGSNTIR